MLLFTLKGKVFALKVYELPEGAKNSKGRHIQNILQIEADDRVVAYLNVPNFDDEQFINSHYIVLATKNGIVKKTSLAEYKHIRRKGITAILIKDGDKLIDAKLTNGNNDIMLASYFGKAIRFRESDVRAVGRAASGVKGMSLEPDDFVIGMICIDNPNYDIIVVSELGYGKRSKLDDYRITSRGGKGVKTINISEKTGNLVAIEAVTDNDDLIVVTQKGQSIRIHVKAVKVSGRTTQGVRLINLNKDDKIATIAKVPSENDNDNDNHIQNEN
jgi:DNA gyrase subunit A